MSISGAAQSRSIDDAYRFPPILSDFELYLHGEGTHHESYNSLGAHICDSLGVPVCALPSGPLMPRWSRWLAISTIGTLAAIRCAYATAASGKYSCRQPARARPTSITSDRGISGHRQLKADPYGFACEVPPKSASVVADIDSYEWEDDGVDAEASADELAEAADVCL